MQSDIDKANAGWLAPLGRGLGCIGRIALEFPELVPYIAIAIYATVYILL